MFRRFYRNEAGFTLIELLVVIIVLGILAGIAVPRLVNIRGKAEDAAIASVAGTIRTAMDVYYIEKGHYPPSSGDDDAITNWDTLCSVLDTADLSADASEYNINEGSFSYAVEGDTFLMTFPSATSGETYYLGEKAYSDDPGEASVLGSSNGDDGGTGGSGSDT